MTREDKEYIKLITITTSKKQTARQRTRLKVTVCLYLNPRDSARSLSTLMAVAVKKESPHKVKLKVMKVMKRVCHLPLSIFIKKATKSGWTITPTQKSVIAKKRSKNFVGGWIDETLCRAMRTRVLPSVAVIARKMFKEQINTKDGVWSITHWKSTWSWEMFIILLRYNEREITRKLKSVTQSKIFRRNLRSSSLLVQKILQSWIEGVVEEVPSL